MTEYFDHFDAAGTDVSGHNRADRVTVDAQKQFGVHRQASSTSGDPVGVTRGRLAGVGQAG